MKKSIVYIVVILSLFMVIALEGIPYDTIHKTSSPDAFSPSYSRFEETTRHFYNSTLTLPDIPQNYTYHLTDGFSPYNLSDSSNYIKVWNDTTTVSYPIYFMQMNFNDTAVITSFSMLSMLYYNYYVNKTIQWCIMITKDWQDPFNPSNLIYSTTIYTNKSFPSSEINITFYPLNVYINKGTYYLGFYTPNIGSPLYIKFFNRPENISHEFSYAFYTFKHSDGTIELLNDFQKSRLYPFSINYTIQGYPPQAKIIYNITTPLYSLYNYSFLYSLTIYYSSLTSLPPSKIVLYMTTSINDTINISLPSNSTLYPLTHYYDDLKQKITHIEVYLLCKPDYHPSLTIKYSIYYNSPPLVEPDHPIEITLNRNSRFNPLSYVNITDTDHDETYITYSPPLSEIDTSIPATYHIDMNITDTAPFPLSTHVHFTLHIINHAPQINLLKYTICYSPPLSKNITYTSNLTPNLNSMNFINISLPANSTLYYIKFSGEFTDTDNDQITLYPSNITLNLNQTAIRIFTLYYTDGFITLPVNITLSAIIPIKYQYHYTHTVIKTQTVYKDRIVYRNNTIEKYIYINTTSNCTNNKTPSEQNGTASTSTSTQQKYDSWKDPKYSFPITVLIFIVIIAITTYMILDKTLPYFFNITDDERPLSTTSRFRNWLKNTNTPDLDEDDFEEEFDEDNLEMPDPDMEAIEPDEIIEPESKVGGDDTS